MQRTTHDARVAVGIVAILMLLLMALLNLGVVVPSDFGFNG